LWLDFSSCERVLQEIPVCSTGYGSQLVGAFQVFENRDRRTNRPSDPVSLVAQEPIRALERYVKSRARFYPSGLPARMIVPESCSPANFWLIELRPVVLPGKILPPELIVISLDHAAQRFMRSHAEG
jgi:hypothetical protein